MRPAVWRDLALLILAGLIVRLLFVAEPGHVVDLRTFGEWALAAADHPWNRAYEVTDANYPPGALLMFEAIGRTYRALHLDDPTSLRIALKLPNLLFDALGTGVVFGLASRLVEPRRALLAAALYALNPAIVYDSSLWGQNDAITTVPTVAAVWCLVARRRISAWLLLAFAVLNKPPVLVLAPLLALEPLTLTGGARRRALAMTAGGIAGALVLAYLIALPFYTERSPLAVFARMIDWYAIGSSLYPYTSANAFNLYSFGGDFFASDTVPVLGVALKYWADAAFIVVAAAIYGRYRQLRDGRALVEACLLVLLAFFLVLTEMHERYLMYALAFAPVLAPLDRRYLWTAIALTVTGWLNLEYSLTYMWIEAAKPPGVDYRDFAPVLVRLCASVNLAAFVVAARVRFIPARGAAGEHATGTG